MQEEDGYEGLCKGVAIFVIICGAGLSVFKTFLRSKRICISAFESGFLKPYFQKVIGKTVGRKIRKYHG